MSPLFLALALVAAPRVLVLGLDPIGVEADVARAVDPLVLNAASEAGAEVIAESEIRKLADVEAAKADMGCDTSSCLSELAGAMGAELVLFGSVTRLGTTTTVNLSLFDNRTTVVRRDALSTQDIGTLPEVLPARVRALIAGPQAPVAAEPAGAGVSPLFVVGIGSVGVGALAAIGGGVLVGLNEAAIQDPAGAAADKASAQTVGRIGLGVLAGGLVVAGVGAVVLVLAGGES